MKVDRLAIVGVLNGLPTQDLETEASAYALLQKHSKSYPAVPWMLQLVKLGPTRGAQDWNADEDTLETGQAMGWGGQHGKLGVYVLAHGSLDGLSGIIDEAKFYVMLKRLDLLSVSKLCLVACMAAAETVVEGNVIGNPSTLSRLCQYLGENGRNCKPVMAGWQSFVTVVNAELFNASSAGSKPMTLGTYVNKRSSGAVLDPSPYEGKKAINGPRSAAILASNPISNNCNEKRFYVYADGVTRVANKDWTDKPGGRI